MTAGDGGKRARLREIETDLAALRADQVAPLQDAADQVDAGQNLAAREELAGQIEALEAERQRLRDELGERG